MRTTSNWRKLVSWWPWNAIETSFQMLILSGLIAILASSLIKARELARHGAPPGGFDSALPVVFLVASVLAAGCLLFLIGVLLCCLWADRHGPRAGCEIVEVPEKGQAIPSPESEKDPE